MSGLSIGQVAMRAGVRASALRYYEQIGLLPAPPRNNGRRSYDLKVFDRLALISFARRAGFSIAEVKLLMSGFTPDTTASARWRDLAKRKERELDAIIALAQERRRAVRAVQRCECRTLDECGHRLRIG